MRQFLFSLSFCLLTSLISAQSISESFRFGKMRIYQDEKSGLFQIKQKKRLIADSLLSVKKLDGNCLELIGSDLKPYCLNKKAEQIVFNYPPNPIRRRRVFCGNSLMGMKDDPHIWIQPYGDSIFVYLNQYYTLEDKVLYSCSRKEVDRLCFVNGQTHYFVDTEVDRPDNLVYDLQLVFIKDGKKGLVGTDELADKDQIWYKEGYVMFKENGLYGYSGINKSGQYKTLGNFKNGYAQFELENGQKGLLNPKGNEIIARK